MIKQTIFIDGYWKVIVFYNVNYKLLEPVYTELRVIGFSKESVKKIIKDLKSQKAKAVTISNLYLHRSVVLFNPHRSWYDYVNSLVHEAEHLKQAMLYAYDIDDSGEPPAYTIGYLAMRMFEVFKYIF